MKVAFWKTENTGWKKRGQRERVPFSQDWLRLCMAQGLEPVLWVQATFVKEESHAGLFEQKMTKRKERKSFFRRP